MSAVRVGVGGPVGSGKTALVDALCKRLSGRYRIAAITNDIYTREDADFLSQCPEGFPRVVIDGWTRARSENIDMAEPAAPRKTIELVTSKLRILHRELGDADQTLGIRRAEVGQPVIIGFVAAPPELRVADCHRIGGTIHDGSFRAVAVHIGQTQLGGGRTQLARAHDAAAFDRPHGATTLRGSVVTMRAEGLTFPGPVGAFFILYDLRSILAQPGRQPPRPQIFGQPTQIDVVVG